MSAAHTPWQRVRNYARAAGEHHATLNVFGAVVALLEGGTVCDPAANSTAQRIISLCLTEQQRQLRKYDAAIAKAMDIVEPT